MHFRALHIDTQGGEVSLGAMEMLCSRFERLNIGLCATHTYRQLRVIWDVPWLRVTSCILCLHSSHEASLDELAVGPNQSQTQHEEENAQDLLAACGCFHF